MSQPGSSFKTSPRDPVPAGWRPDGNGAGLVLNKLPASRPPFYSSSEAQHAARRGKCLLKLGRPADAVHIIGTSLNHYTARKPQTSGLYIHTGIAVAKLELSEARIQSGDIDESAATLASVADFVARNRANRLVRRVHAVRTALRPWNDTPAVRQLDDQLHTVGLPA